MHLINHPRLWALSALKASRGNVANARLKLAADATIHGVNPTDKRLGFAFLYIEEVRK